MKKLFALIIVVAVIMVMPITAYAKVVSTNLKETVEDSGIEFKYNDYKETDDQVVIYLFRWNQCGHCHEFISFLNDIAEEYGKYFKLVAYESTTNQDNNKLWKEVSKLLDGQEATGYPYIVIGKQSFGGYSEELNDEIIETIKKLYDTKKEDRYDVIKEVNNKPNYDNIVLVVSGLIVTGIIALAVITRRTNSEE